MVVECAPPRVVAVEHTMAEPQPCHGCLVSHVARLEVVAAKLVTKTEPPCSAFATPPPPAAVRLPVKEHGATAAVDDECTPVPGPRKAPRIARCVETAARAPSPTAAACAAAQTRSLEEKVF